MEDLFSPEDREVLEEQLERRVGYEEEDIRPLNLDFENADVDFNGGGDDDDDEFQDVSERFDDKCTGWTREKFIEEICAREGYNGLFKG